LSYLGNLAYPWASPNNLDGNKLTRPVEAKKKG